MAREGFYSIKFAGASDWGAGMLVLDTGKIYGVDVGDVLYDGDYEFNPRTGMIDFDLVLTVPPGTALVTGVPVSRNSLKIQVGASVPADLKRGQPHNFQVRVGNFPVNVQMTNVRDLPA